MASQHSAGEGETPERFEYFMIRVARSTTEPEKVSGLVERLGSGEKRSFDTGEQLVQLVGGRFTPQRNRQPADGDPNTMEP
jgi:hypothetical protein